MSNKNGTHTKQKKQLYRWVGLVIGLILGSGISFGYYKWAKKKAVVYFQENIGESGFRNEYQKWATKNPLQAREMAEKTWKEMGLYEELKNETSPEIIQQKLMAKREQMSEEERRKSIRTYEKTCPVLFRKSGRRIPLKFAVLLVNHNFNSFCQFWN